MTHTYSTVYSAVRIFVSIFDDSVFLKSYFLKQKKLIYTMLVNYIVIILKVQNKSERELLTTATIETN